MSGICCRIILEEGVRRQVYKWNKIDIEVITVEVANEGFMGICLYYSVHFCICLKLLVSFFFLRWHRDILRQKNWEILLPAELGSSSQQMENVHKGNQLI